MQIKSLLVAPLIASGVMAATKSTPFEVVAIGQGSGVHLKALQAGRGGFYFNLPTEKATCKSTSDNTATLQLVDDELFLYNSDHLIQRAYNDLSGMGQGVLRYADDNGELTGGRLQSHGWKIDSNNNLVFGSKNPIGVVACPGAVSGGYSVWMDGGFQTPGGNKNCKPVSLRVIKSTKPNSCSYTK